MDQSMLDVLVFRGCTCDKWHSCKRTWRWATNVEDINPKYICGRWLGQNMLVDGSMEHLWNINGIEMEYNGLFMKYLMTGWWYTYPSEKY